MDPESLPAGIPPTGVTSNFNDPSSLYPEMLAAVVICSSLTTIFTLARLFTRWTVSAWAIEDYCLSLAWAFNIAYDFVFLGQGIAGTGRHIWDVRAVDGASIAKYQWALSHIYCPAMWLAKAAILFQLVHIFSPTKTGPIYRAVHILIWGNLAFYISVWFTIIFQCVPQKKIWEPQYEKGGCINFYVAALATGSVNVVSDFLILLLPLVAIWRLHMAPERRVGVAAVFATGLLAVASSICRLGYTTKFFTHASRGDDTYIDAQVGMWTLAEFATLILIACFPIMPRFVQLMFAKSNDKRSVDSRPSWETHSRFLKDSSTLDPYKSGTTDAWARRADDTDHPKRSYIPLMDNNPRRTAGPYGPTGNGGIERTISIELSTSKSIAKREPV